MGRSSGDFGAVIATTERRFCAANASSAAESLRQMMTTHTNVLRDGKRQEIDAVNLVVGDVVQLQSGDKVPPMFGLPGCCRDLQVDESADRRISPVIKKEEILDPETILADRRNMAMPEHCDLWPGTGGAVVATGDGTETGRISELITSAADLSTPLTKKLLPFSKSCCLSRFFLAAATFAVGLWRGENAVDMFMAAVAWLLARFPKGCPRQ